MLRGGRYKPAVPANNPYTRRVQRYHSEQRIFIGGYKLQAGMLLVNRLGIMLCGKGCPHPEIGDAVDCVVQHPFIFLQVIDMDMAVQAQTYFFTFFVCPGKNCLKSLYVFYASSARK